jgi:hypothetical protein
VNWQCTVWIRELAVHGVNSWTDSAPCEFVTWQCTVWIRELAVHGVNSWTGSARYEFVNWQCTVWIRELTLHRVNRQTDYNYLHQTQSSWRWRQLAPPNSRNKTYHETWDSHCDVAEDSSLLACYTVSLGVTPRHNYTALKPWKKHLCHVVLMILGLIVCTPS